MSHAQAIMLIVLLGVSAQWIAWRIGAPSILLLLFAGFLAGPVTGALRPDTLIDQTLLAPLVSLSVALILYEGGLTLKLSELAKVGRVVWKLVSLGMAVTWLVATLAAGLIFDLEWPMATLLGALLSVTGPTVIGPLLRHIRPSGPVAPILKWEGIVIDPIGALLALFVFEWIHAAGTSDATAGVARGLAMTVFAGGGLGWAAAALLTQFIKRFWIPDFLQNPISLMMVVVVFTVSNQIQLESGLLAVTVMGIALANQRAVDVRHIVEFKENLRVMLLSALFIVLAARLDLHSLTSSLLQGALFVAVLVVVARPLAVFVSTWGEKLSRREVLFLAWMAPRGIVAAAIASVFALRLELRDPAADVLTPITFITIIGTVALYGLTAPLVARRLGVADANPQGLLFVGAPAWARDLAKLVREKGYAVLMVDTNRQNTAAARMAGLPTYPGSILAEYAIEELSLGGIGQLLAVTPNDWVNTLAAQRFRSIFGSERCYQLPPADASERDRASHRYLQARWLFGAEHDYADLAQRYERGARMRATSITESYTYKMFREGRPDALPLFVITEAGRLALATAEKPLKPVAGQTLVSLRTQPADKPPGDRPAETTPADSAAR